MHDTSAATLGFGCAGVSRVSHRRDRQRLIEAALESGYRHFDAAPMYGLGQCERELGQVLEAAGDQPVVATKFGIGLSAVGRLAGLMQAPVRSVLSRMPVAQEGVSQSGADPSAGVVGRVLYTRPSPTTDAIAASVDRSRRELGRSRIDVLFLHEPRLLSLWESERIAGVMADLQRRGVIGTWGYAGELAPRDLSSMQRRRAEVIQCPIGNRRAVSEVAVDQQLMLFGVVGPHLAALRGYRDRHPQEASSLSEKLDIDVMRDEDLAGLVIRHVVDSHPGVVVLVSSRRVERVGGLMQQSQRPRVKDEGRVMQALMAQIERETGRAVSS